MLCLSIEMIIIIRTLRNKEIKVLWLVAAGPFLVGRGREMTRGPGGADTESGGAKRSAAPELTCSQSLNSSAWASSLSVWGRWISVTLH